MIYLICWAIGLALLVYQVYKIELKIMDLQEQLWQIMDDMNICHWKLKTKDKGDK